MPPDSSSRALPAALPLFAAVLVLAAASDVSAQPAESGDEAMPSAARIAANRPPDWTTHARAARSHARFGEWAEAEAEIEAALAALPANDPTGIRRRTLAGQIALLSDAAWADGRIEDAARISERVVETYDAAGVEPLSLAVHLIRIARLATLEGDFAKANAALDRALALRIAALGENDSQVIEVRASLASLYIASERFDEADAELAIALQIVEGQGEAARERTVPLRLGIAKLRIAQARYDEAVAELSQVVELQKEALGESSPELAFTLRQLAEAHHEAGEDRIAQKLLVESVAMLRGTFPDHPLLALAENDYAWFLADTGRPKQALDHIQKALDILASNELDGPMLGAVLDTQARALVVSGRMEDAEATYRRAIEEFEKGDISHRADLEQSRERLAELLSARVPGTEEAVERPEGTPTSGS